MLGVFYAESQLSPFWLMSLCWQSSCIMLTVILLRVILLTVILLTVILVTIILQTGILLTAMAPIYSLSLKPGLLWRNAIKIFTIMKWSSLPKRLRKITTNSFYRTDFPTRVKTLWLLCTPAKLFNVCKVQTL